jgi:hypothetical protein
MEGSTTYNGSIKRCFPLSVYIGDLDNSAGKNTSRGFASDIDGAGAR